MSDSAILDTQVWCFGDWVRPLMRRAKVEKGGDVECFFCAVNMIKGVSPKSCVHAPLNKNGSINQSLNYFSQEYMSAIVMMSRAAVETDPDRGFFLNNDTMLSALAAVYGNFSEKHRAKYDFATADWSGDDVDSTSRINTASGSPRYVPSSPGRDITLSTGGWEIDPPKAVVAALTEVESDEEANDSLLTFPGGVGSFAPHTVVAAVSGSVPCVASVASDGEDVKMVATVDLGSKTVDSTYNPFSLDYFKNQPGFSFTAPPVSSSVIDFRWSNPEFKIKADPQVKPKVLALTAPVSPLVFKFESTIESSSTKPSVLASLIREVDPAHGALQVDEAFEDISHPSVNVSEPTERFVYYRGKTCMDKTSKKELSDFFNRQDVKDLFKLVAQSDNVTSPCGYIFAIPGYQSSIYNYRGFERICGELTKKFQERDGGGMMPNLHLGPYVMVKHKINPRFNVDGEFDYIAGRSKTQKFTFTCRTCGKSDQVAGHLCACKKCGVSYEDGKRHKCNQTSASSSEPKREKSVAQVQPMQSSVALTKPVAVVPVVVTSPTPVSVVVAPVAVASVPTTVAADPPLESGEGDGKQCAEEVMKDLQDKYEKVEPTEMVCDELIKNLIYETAAASHFEFNFPSSPMQIVDLVRKANITKVVLVYIIILLSCMVESLVYLPISRAIFYRQPDGAFARLLEYLYGQPYYYTYWAFANWIVNIVWVCFMVGWVGYQSVSTASFYLQKDVVTQHSFSFVSKLPTQLADSRPQNMKMGPVQQHDPEIWEVEYVSTVWNSSATKNIVSRGLFFTTIRKTMYVSLAIVKNLSVYKTLNSTSDLSQIKRNMENSLKTCTTINIPNNLVTQGIRVYDDSMVFMLHNVQSLRVNENIFTD